MDGVETTKFPEISSTHLIDLEKMKGWVDLGASQWFWTREPWIGNPASSFVSFIKTFKVLSQQLCFNYTLHKKWSFPLRISSLNVTKFALSCGFGDIYWRHPYRKLHFLWSGSFDGGGKHEQQRNVAKILKFNCKKFYNN